MVVYSHLLLNHQRAGGRGDLAGFLCLRPSVRETEQSVEKSAYFISIVLSVLKKGTAVGGRGDMKLDAISGQPASNMQKWPRRKITIQFCNYASLCSQILRRESIIYAD